MGTNYSPRIVTDGLILCLDAGDRKSYPGTGTTWTDRSGQDNNAISQASASTTEARFNTNGYFDLDEASDVYFLISGLNNYNFGSNVSIDFLYSPVTCGISSRGCLMTYTADYFCNGTPDGLERSLSATIFGVDSQPRDAQAYLVPYPYPADCPDRSCWTLVTSAVNTNGRNIC